MHNHKPIPARVAVVVCVAAWLLASGCAEKKKPARVFVPPPVIAKVPPPVVDLDLNKFPELPPYTPPNEIEPPAIQVTGSLPPAPPKPTPAKPNPAKPPVIVETPPPVAAPKPATILTAQERSRLTQELTTHLAAAQRVLDRVGGRQLAPDLAETAANIRTFMKQAEQERARDLSTAVNFATRAERFANDLLARLP